QHGQYENRTAVGDKRQRQTGRGEQPDDDADVQIRREHGDECQTDGNKLQKRRSRLTSNAESEHGVKREGKGNGGKADEPPLFADVAGDEVAVRIRQEARLLAPLAEADAKGAAGTDGKQRLLELVVHRSRRATRIQKRRDAQYRVLQS